ncbi:hypothetical protein ACW95P_04060 [Candidatus Mycoplasma pogonae]
MKIFKSIKPIHFATIALATTPAILVACGAQTLNDATQKIFGSQMSEKKFDETFEKVIELSNSNRDLAIYGKYLTNTSIYDAQNAQFNPKYFNNIIFGDRFLKITDLLKEYKTQPSSKNETPLFQAIETFMNKNIENAKLFDSKYVQLSEKISGSNPDKLSQLQTLNVDLVNEVVNYLLLKNNPELATNSQAQDKLTKLHNSIQTKIQSTVNFVKELMEILDEVTITKFNSFLEDLNKIPAAGSSENIISQKFLELKKDFLEKPNIPNYFNKNQTNSNFYSLTQMKNDLQKFTEILKNEVKLNEVLNSKLPEKEFNTQNEFSKKFNEFLLTFEIFQPFFWLTYDINFYNDELFNVKKGWYWNTDSYLYLTKDFYNKEIIEELNKAQNSTDADIIKIRDFNTKNTLKIQAISAYLDSIFTKFLETSKTPESIFKSKVLFLLNQYLSNYANLKNLENFKYFKEVYANQIENITKVVNQNKTQVENIWEEFLDNYKNFIKKIDDMNPAVWNELIADLNNVQLNLNNPNPLVQSFIKFKTSMTSEQSVIFILQHLKQFLENQLKLAQEMGLDNLTQMHALNMEIAKFK